MHRPKNCMQYDNVAHATWKLQIFREKKKEFVEFQFHTN